MGAIGTGALALALAAASLLSQAAPVPSPAPSDACNHPATVVHPEPPDYPNSIRPLGLPATTAQVLVTVAADGSIVETTVYKSSGYKDLDDSTLAAARKSTYAPKLVNCKPADRGGYLFSATFTPD